MGVRNPVRNFSAALASPRWRWAFGAALASDALSFGMEASSLGLAEPLQIAVDLATALVLLALLGFRWSLAGAFVLEAFPGTSLFPCWALAVAAQAAAETAAPKGPGLEPPKEGC